MFRLELLVKNDYLKVGHTRVSLCIAVGSRMFSHFANTFVLVRRKRQEDKERVREKASRTESSSFFYLCLWLSPFFSLFLFFILAIVIICRIHDDSK